MIECENGFAVAFACGTRQGFGQHLDRLSSVLPVDEHASGFGGTNRLRYQNLALAHGGEVRVRSELGQGSVFEIDLRQGRAEASGLVHSIN